MRISIHNKKNGKEDMTASYQANDYIEAEQIAKENGYPYIQQVEGGWFAWDNKPEMVTWLNQV